MAEEIAYKISFLGVAEQKSRLAQITAEIKGLTASNKELSKQTDKTTSAINKDANAVELNIIKITKLKKEHKGLINTYKTLI